METPVEIINLTDIALLEFLCSVEDDGMAYKHFVERFVDDVQTECKRICEARRLDSHVGKQIAHEVFERVRKYKTFRKDEIKLPNNRRAINVYLNKIAVRLFDDHYRNENKKEVLHRTYFDDILETADSHIDLKSLKNKKDVALLIFKRLNAKEQKVVLTDMEHKKHQKYLPDEVTDILASELNVELASIRKIRQRAIIKIKKAIDEINQN